VKLAIFGGTFDPIHDGHLALAREAAARCRLDRVLFVPAAHPPHKAGATHASFVDLVKLPKLLQMVNATRQGMGAPGIRPGLVKDAEGIDKRLGLMQGILTQQLARPIPIPGNTRAAWNLPLAVNADTTWLFRGSVGFTLGTSSAASGTISVAGSGNHQCALRLHCPARSSIGGQFNPSGQAAASYGTVRFPLRLGEPDRISPSFSTPCF